MEESHTPSHAEERLFANGACVELALALSRLTGGEMVALLEPSAGAFHGGYLDYVSFRETGWLSSHLKAAAPAEVRDYIKLFELRLGRETGPLSWQALTEAELLVAGSWEMYHVYCLLPDGRSVDIHGVRDEASLVYDWVFRSGDHHPRRLTARRPLGPLSTEFSAEEPLPGRTEVDLLQEATDLLGRLPDFFGLPRAAAT